MVIQKVFCFRYRTRHRLDRARARWSSCLKCARRSTPPAVSSLQDRVILSPSRRSCLCFFSLPCSRRRRRRRRASARFLPSRPPRRRGADIRLPPHTGSTHPPSRSCFLSFWLVRSGERLGVVGLGRPSAEPLGQDGLVLAPGSRCGLAELPFICSRSPLNARASACPRTCSATHPPKRVVGRARNHEAP